METSIFTEKSVVPTEQTLSLALGGTYPFWKQVRNLVFEKYPSAVEEWNYPGQKYGWSFRIKDKRRAILYLLPRDNFFKVAMVFGQKATDKILASGVHERIKAELRSARVYAEGRGIRIEVRDDSLFGDLEKLIDIKLGI